MHKKLRKITFTVLLIAAIIQLIDVFYVIAVYQKIKWNGVLLVIVAGVGMQYMRSTAEKPDETKKNDTPPKK